MVIINLTFIKIHQWEGLPLMFKIKDKIILGAFSAVVTMLILNIVDWASVFLKANKWHIWQIAASLYFGAKDLNTAPALFIGAMAHTVILSFSGVIICYVLYYTGRDFYLLKGLGINLMFWIFLFGVILKINIARINPTDAGTNMSHFVGHVLAGLLMSYFIVKFADDRAWKARSIPS